MAGRLPDGLYQISHAWDNNRYVLQADDDNIVRCWQASNSDNQKWYLEYDDEVSSYFIQNKNEEGYYLYLKQVKIGDDSVWIPAVGPPQIAIDEWEIKLLGETSDGNYHIQHPLSQFAISLQISVDESSHSSEPYSLAAMLTTETEESTRWTLKKLEVSDTANGVDVLE